MTVLAIRTLGDPVLREHAAPVHTWTLMGVVPVRWTGPSMSVDSAKVATETLELAHHGFLELGAV